MSSIINSIYTPLNPYQVPRPDVQRKIDGKHGEDAVIDLNISIRDEQGNAVREARQTLLEALAHLDREFGGSHYA